MTPPATGDAVFVEAPARLHFGVLDLRGALGRTFGGIGAAAPAPALLRSATPAAALSVEGPEAARAADYAARFFRHHGLPPAGHLVVHRALPAHAGLGSGTQLALATARALAELHGLPTEAGALSRAVGRARRSAIGTWTFGGGGFVLEGGRRPGSDDPAPLLARFTVPPSWRCVVVLPDAAPGVSGEAEMAAFADLPLPESHEVEQVAHLVLMALLPALAEADLPTFGAALTRIQEITGAWFAASQGGTFAPGPSAALVARMRDWGAAGVGQSSWGPAVYALVEGAEAGAALAAHVRDTLAGGTVHEGPIPNVGARVWRAPRNAVAPAD
jgi:beta-RFAP synthase